MDLPLRQFSAVRILSQTFFTEVMAQSGRILLKSVTQSYGIFTNAVRNLINVRAVYQNLESFIGSIRDWTATRFPYQLVLHYTNVGKTIMTDTLLRILMSPITIASRFSKPPILPPPLPIGFRTFERTIIESISLGASASRVNNFFRAVLQSLSANSVGSKITINRVASIVVNLLHGAMTSREQRHAFHNLPGERFTWNLHLIGIIMFMLGIGLIILLECTRRSGAPKDSGNPVDRDQPPEPMPEPIPASA
jgi:hypothetical protein